MEEIDVFSFDLPPDSLNGARPSPRKATRRAIELIGLIPVESSLERVHKADLDPDGFVIGPHPLPDVPPTPLKDPLS